MDKVCDIIIPTWNQLETTKECIGSLIASASMPLQLIVVDNASTDGTQEYLSSIKERENCAITLILNSENKGFVRGINQGLGISKAPYVCFANNDLIFTKGWIDEIILLFKNNSKIGVLNPNSNNLGVMPPLGIPLDRFAGDLNYRYSGIFVEMPFCIGFCMVIKRELIDKIGGLSDEFYPMFFEDTDYSMRAKKEGYLVGMSKASYVLHKEHTSISKLGLEKEEIFKRSREIYLKKWGKDLRIAWIVNNYDELKNNLVEGLELARAGNYVWFITKVGMDREGIFRYNRLSEHSGVQFLRSHNFFDILWKILKKKKKYDLVITNSKFLEIILRMLGYKVTSTVKAEQINKIKLRIKKEQI